MVPPKAAQRSGTKQEVSSSVSISKRSTKHAAADAETGIKRIRHEEDDNTPSRSGKLSRHQETSKFTLRGSTQHGADMISDEDDNRTVFRTASAPAPARVAPPGLISPAQGGQPRTAHVQPPTWMSDMSDTGLAELSAQIQSVIARRQTLTALPATHPVLTAPVQHFPHGLMDPYTSQLQYIKDMGPFPSIPIHPRQHQYNAQQYGQQYPPAPSVMYSRGRPRSFRANSPDDGLGVLHPAAQGRSRKRRANSDGSEDNDSDLQVYKSQTTYGQSRSRKRRANNDNNDLVVCDNYVG